MRERVIRNNSGRLLGIAELQAYVNMGRNSAERLAIAAGAKIKIGNRALYDIHRIDAYIDQQLKQTS